MAIYKNWEPVNSGDLSEASSATIQSGDSTSSSYVTGCSGGHPADIVLRLIEEVRHLTALVTEGELNLLTIVPEVNKILYLLWSVYFGAFILTRCVKHNIIIVLVTAIKAPFL